MLFEPRVYNLSVLMVGLIPLHSFNRAGGDGAKAWRTVTCVPQPLQDRGEFATAQFCADNR
jgi:hypothetical protein